MGKNEGHDDMMVSYGFMGFKHQLWLVGDLPIICWLEVFNGNIIARCKGDVKNFHV
jgi:hypothetical protein